MVRAIHHVVVAQKHKHGPLQKTLNTVALHALAQLHKVKNVIHNHVLLIVEVRGVIIHRVMNHVVVVHRQEHGPLQLYLLMVALRVLVQLWNLKSVTHKHVLHQRDHQWDHQWDHQRDHQRDHRGNPLIMITNYT